MEQNTFCQGILKKHWPNATIFDDVRTVGAHNLQPIDLLCAGFPCQDLSSIGKQKGIHNGKKSNLFWELHRIISQIQPRIICLENVANIIRLGGIDVVKSLAQIGYSCEWTVVRSGSDFGAPHHRARWFCVAYSFGFSRLQANQKSDNFREKWQAWQNVSRSNRGVQSRKCNKFESNQRKTTDTEKRKGTYWTTTKIPQPAILRVDDGFSNKLDKAKQIEIYKERVKTLGNAIVPQASEWVGRQIVQSGLIDDLID